MVPSSLILIVLAESVLTFFFFHSLACISLPNFFSFFMQACKIGSGRIHQIIPNLVRQIKKSWIRFLEAHEIFSPFLWAPFTFSNTVLILQRYLHLSDEFYAMGFELV